MHNNTILFIMQLLFVTRVKHLFLRAILFLPFVPASVLK